MKKAVFLDRDGVINEICYHDQKGIYSAMDLDEFKTFPGVKDAIKRLKDNGFLVIVVANQPGVAFGYLKKENVDKIDEFMRNDLGVDAVYNCFHHPKYTGECDCRKPKDGLLVNASKDFDIDITESFMVGDNIMDILAGKKCKKFFFIGKLRADLIGLFEKYDVKPDCIINDLKEAVDSILKE
jgi:D-glycero-D-manno-heptose 1,7-bisphosphate phosphatase